MAWRFDNPDIGQVQIDGEKTVSAVCGMDVGREDEDLTFKQAYLRSLPGKLLVFGPITIGSCFDALEVAFAFALYGLLFILVWEFVAHSLGNWLTAFVFITGQTMVLYFIGHYE